MKNILVIGGAGYVGSMLVPLLIQKGYTVTVLDKFWYGKEEVFPHVKDPGKLILVSGDIRHSESLRKAMEGQDGVIHLACISNDPSFELDPGFGKEINLLSFPGVLAEVKRARVKRFIYASSSSVYGIQDTPNVTEDTPCKPLTDYSLFKLQCEHILRTTDMKDVEWAILRPATVCGWAPRLRLDLAVNVLTIDALVKKKITVFGGDQLRPNINIKDMVRAYSEVMVAPKSQVHKQTFNVGFQNKSLLQIAQMVKDVIGGEINRIEGALDNRSYHINSDKIQVELGFEPEGTIESAIRSIMLAYAGGKIINPLTNSKYYNMRRMKELYEG